MGWDRFIGQRRIQPDQLQQLLLMIRPARPSLAEVPLAELSFNFGNRAPVSIRKSF